MQIIYLNDGINNINLATGLMAVIFFILYIITMPLFVILIYLICSLLEYLRESLFMILTVKERTDSLCKKLDANVTKLIDNK